MNQDLKLSVVSTTEFTLNRQLKMVLGKETVKLKAKKEGSFGSALPKLREFYGRLENNVMLITIELVPPKIYSKISKQNSKIMVI